jgi:hypothetical protein
VGPTAIYRPFSKLPLIIPGDQGVHFSNSLQPRDQRPTTYIIVVPGSLFILIPRGAFFHIMVRYARVLSQLSHTCSYLWFSSDIVHFGYLIVLCVGT